MLINISNHLFTDWDELQKEEAIYRFTAVVDFPFPRVDPGADLPEIEKLADEIVNEICMKYQLSCNVHVMGEFTLCYQLVKRFFNLKINCYASTGKDRESDFSFVQFRPYFNL